MYIWSFLHKIAVAGVRLQVNRELEARFREAAMRRFGFAKGALSRAAEEAIQLWLSSIEGVGFEGDPIEALDGLLSGVKIDSVRMQHSATDIWAGIAKKHVSR